jgi:hypothetical protein
MPNLRTRPRAPPLRASVAFTHTGKGLIDIGALEPADRARARSGRLGRLYVEWPLTPTQRRRAEKKLEDALAEIAAVLVGARTARQLRRRRTTARKRASVAS